MYSDGFIWRRCRVIDWTHDPSNIKWATKPQCKHCGIKLISRKPLLSVHLFIFVADGQRTCIYIKHDYIKLTCMRHVPPISSHKKALRSQRINLTFPHDFVLLLIHLQLSRSRVQIVKIHRTQQIVEQQHKRPEKFWQDGLHTGKGKKIELRIALIWWLIFQRIPSSSHLAGKS